MTNEKAEQKMDSVVDAVGSDELQCVGMLWLHPRNQKLYIMAIPGPTEEFYRLVKKMDVLVEGKLKDIADR